MNINRDALDQLGIEPSVLEAKFPWVIGDVPLVELDGMQRLFDAPDCIPAVTRTEQAVAQLIGQLADLLAVSGLEPLSARFLAAILRRPHGGIGHPGK
jgi:hypothetical protein